MESKKERPGSYRREGEREKDKGESNYRIPVIIILSVLILVMIRSFGPGFRPDAGKWAEQSLSGSEIISSAELGSLPPDRLIISLDEMERNLESLHPVSIAPDSILSANNIKLIRKNNGPVVLAASDVSVAARLWMVLRQMGIKDLFILAEKDIENPKNKFRPDTLFRPEL